MNILKTFATSLVLIAVSGLAAEPDPALSEERIREVYGPSSGLIAILGNAPVVDGSAYEEAWRGVPVKHLRYADGTLPGPAKFGADVKVAADAEHLYVSFHARVKGTPKAGERKSDDPKIVEEHFVGFSLTDQEANALAVAVNAAGSVYHARYDGKAWDASWNPEVIQAASRIEYGFWSVEIKLGLQDLASIHRGEAEWRANFFRSDALGHAPEKPGGRENLYTAWMPGAFGLHAARTGGTLIYPKGKGIDEVRKRPAEDAKAAAHALDSRVAPNGFAFSAAQLREAFPGGPVLLVPLVAEPPRLDGDPADAAWTQAPRTQLGFLDAELHGYPESNRTFVRLVSDAEHLYALYECEEAHMDQINTERGALWSHDVANLLLDVGRSLDFAGGRYFMLEANAKGRCTASRGDGFHWMPSSYEAATRLEKDRWVLEWKIAFADLGIDANNFPKLFGANFTRYRTPGRGSLDADNVAHPNYESAWRGNLLDTPHVLDRFGVLYLQAGNALPKELLARLTAAGKDPAALGLKAYTLPEPQPQPVAPQPVRTAKFKTAPSVEIAGGKALIAFETEAPVDAAVSILNEQGETVRHLAAGLLGPQAPAPFKKDSNAQKLEWDFTDDYRQKVPAGSYSAKVALGVKAQFERVLIGDPHRMSNLRGMSVDAEGTVYVLMEDTGPAHYRIANIVAYNRDGKFVRHVFPFPGRLPKEKVRGANVIENPDGGWLPVTYQALLHAFIPQFGSLRTQRPAITKSGKLLLVNNVDEIRMRIPKRILRIGTDGSVEEDLLGPLLGHEPFGGKAALALSPDEQWLYVTGLSGNSQWSPEPPHHVVYRVNLSGENPPLKDGYAEPWLGERFVPGAGETHFSDPSGLAVDAQGLVYVADTGNDRIAVFQPDGKFAREIKIAAPAQVEVHPKSGALYVLSLKGKGTKQIVKLNAEGKEVASLTVKDERRAENILALDPGAEPPVLWYIAERRKLHKVVEKDGKFEDLGDVIFHSGDTSNDLARRNNLQNFELSPDGKHLGIWGLRYDAVTGKFLPDLKGPLLTRGLDGRLYHFVPKWEIRRFSADGKPDPFPKGVKGSEPGLEGVLPAKTCYYFTVDRDGNVYTMSDQLDKKFGTAVHKYKSDGSLETTAFIQLPLPSKSSGPVATLECSPDGSFYLACNIKKPGETVPPLFKGRLPRETGTYPGPWMSYEHFYASVVKFGPEGGRIEYDDGGPWLVGSNYGGIHPAKVEGIQWAHLGISPLVYRNRDHARCTCEHGSFGMDGYGRLFIPDAFQARVEVIDANANVLTRFGRYGNQDARGPGSPEGEPEIGFAWPVRVRVHGDACFVADRVNHRILRLKLTYLEEKEAGFRAQ